MPEPAAANRPALTAVFLLLSFGAGSRALAQDAGSTRSPAPATAQPAQSQAAQATPTQATPAKADQKVPPAPLAGEAQASVQKYCANIAAAATDARFAWQSKKLLDLETRIKASVAELDARQAELKSWMEKREAISKQARDNLVGIYAKMKPETAAAQIGALDDDMAIAVLAALSPGKASAIFNEITPTERAAKLAGLLANPAAGEKKL